MADLKALVQHRKDILLAEVAAWLHDVGKFTNRHIQHHTGGTLKWGNAGSYKVVVGDPTTVLSPSCSLSQIEHQLSRRLKQILQNRTPTFFSHLQTLQAHKAAEWERISTQFSLYVNERWSIAELVMLGLPGASKPAQIQNCFGKDGWLSAALGISHGTAHHDKQDGDSPQSYPDVYISSAFGYERPLKDLDRLLERALPINTSWQIPNDWPLFWHDTRIFAAFSLVHGLGDTRRPVNEVSLLDWGWTVAALFKSAAANKIMSPGISITNGNTHDLRWRLLSIRTNGLEYLFSASSIPDLLARKNLLTDAWNRVQKVLEEKYPLGLEVYRDENGPVFVVPDLADLLDLSNSADNHKTLREYILEAFRQGTVKDDPYLAIDGEIVPDFKLDDQPWKGQPAPQELPPIGEHLKTPPILKSDSAAIAQQWSNLSKLQEICTVCGLRPQGPGKKAKIRKMCDVCEQRRADRAKAWSEGISLSLHDRFKQGKPDTIWMDEVADKNGRLALIVGTFDLTYWLDGTLGQSLAVRNPQNVSDKTKTEEIAKNPSFARLRRIWETTRRFWQDVAPTDIPPKELKKLCNESGLNIKELWEGPLSLEDSLAGEALGEKRPRLFLKGTLTWELWPFHAYEMMVQGRKVAVLWVPPDAVDEKGNPLSYRGGFWVIENLEYLAGKNIFGRPLDKVLTKNSVYDIYEPSEYGKPREATSRFTLQDVTKIDKSYVPLIPILAEPRTFMAIVPADKAVEVVKSIRTKYEREMGKVRNRLPLHLGIVYADAHTPLRAILDAGRRMLKQGTLKEVDRWKVVGEVSKQTGSLPSEVSTLTQDTQQFDEWYPIRLEHEVLKRKLTWYVPAVMGDGKTPDHWYPYVFWVRDKKGNTEPANATEQRDRYYQAPNPFNPDKKGNPQLGWLVHAGELQPGDVIYFTPATFDFEFLEVNARRFEIAYDKSGKRENSLTRPYLLDEIEELEKIWKFIAKEDVESEKSRLSSSQIFAIRDKIEEKREEWFENPEDSLKDETFKKLCENLLTNAQWRVEITSDEIQWLTDMAVRGYLTDAIYLYHHVMKDKPVDEEE